MASTNLTIVCERKLPLMTSFETAFNTLAAIFATLQERHLEEFSEFLVSKMLPISEHEEVAEMFLAACEAFPTLGREVVLANLEHFRPPRANLEAEERF